MYVFFNRLNTDPPLSSQIHSRAALHQTVLGRHACSRVYHGTTPHTQEWAHVVPTVARGACGPTCAVAKGCGPGGTQIDGADGGDLTV
jgi:hypothetical protein